MSVSKAYLAYLDAGCRRQEAEILTQALYQARYYLEARLLVGYFTYGKAEMLVADPNSVFLGRRVWLAPEPPPRAAAGDLWLDIWEMGLMMLVPSEPMPLYAGPPPPPSHRLPLLHAWLSVRPVARWQYRAFLERADLAPFDAPEPPLSLFDRTHTTAEPDNVPVTGITRDEAAVYARWYGKSLADLIDWQAARTFVAPATFDALWQATHREWSSSVCASDPSLGVLATPATLDVDPNEALKALDEGRQPPEAQRILCGRWDAPSDVGFRTAVPVQRGLIKEPLSMPVVAGNRRLTSILSRVTG